MRPLLLAAALLLTVPAEAQVRLGVLANTGYDFGFGAPSVGAAVEVAWAPRGSAIGVALRPSVDVVFVDAVPVAVTYGSDSPHVGYESNAVRLGAEAVGRWARPTWPVAPYLKAGVVFESVSARSFDVVSPQERTDAVAGAGVVWRRVYAEVTHGFGDASRNRVALGITL